ncbi:hypothetical protein GQ457_17G011470 [Hibiscus cannabinus]
MMFFINAKVFHLWDIVEDGPFVPTTIKSEWSANDRKKMELNCKALHIIFGALVWDKLEVIHEGTNDVKETKIGLLNLEYENFKIDPNEDNKSMVDRFSTIANQIKGFGEEIPKDKLHRKLIYSLPQSWDSKKMVIIKALQKTESKEAESEKSLINGPNLVSEKKYEDFIEQLIEAPLDHSSYEKESFSIDVEDRSLTVGLDSRTNPFEEWGNDMFVYRSWTFGFDSGIPCVTTSGRFCDWTRSRGLHLLVSEPGYAIIGNVSEVSWLLSCGMARPRRGVRGGEQAPVHLDEIEIEQGNEEILPPLPPSAFLKKYLGTRYEDEKKREFMALVQGSMSVADYEIQFVRLSQSLAWGRQEGKGIKA